jgi:NAD(P)-dependent dehydrogenase (short-subunit alcohol dehydrogenase family)
MRSVYDKVVAVTGAAAGLGRALALQLAARGAHLAIADVDSTRLDETANQLAMYGGRVTTHVVDVRKRDAVYAYASETERAHGGADIIINNAGLCVRSRIDEVSDADFELVVDVNLWGVVHGTRAFLPLLRKRPEGHIVNISSINAMVPFARCGPYNVAKSAVLGFSETLSQELHGSSIAVTCVHPGGIRTDFVRNTKGATAGDIALFHRTASTRPDVAAAAIVAAIGQNAPQVFVGLDAKMMALAKRLLPRWTTRVAGHFTVKPPAL